MLTVRKTTEKDIPAINAIYTSARAFMRQTGNPTQWNDGYPEKELLLSDIKKGELFVLDEGAGICACFALIGGIDPTYGYIEGGSWLSDSDYGTIHRIASSGERKGLLHICMEYCLQQTDYIRIDTHHDNKVMQYLILKEGFTTCGVIYAIDGNPRIAYDYMK